VTVALHAAADHGTVEHAERSEQGRGAVPLIVMRHRLTAARLDRQSGLGAVEGLDLALLVDRQHHGMGRWIDIKPNDVGQLGGKTRVTRALEGAQPVRLQFMRPPDALHRAYRNADSVGHRPASPMSGLVRRRGAGQRHHPRRGRRRDWRLAGLAGLVAQQTLNPALGKTLLPPPYRRPADTDALRYPLRRVTIGRGEHNVRPLDVLARPVTVGHDRRQLLALHRAQYHAYRLSHGPFPPDLAQYCTSQRRRESSV
jgi:hypothetical protein